MRKFDNFVDFDPMFSTIRNLEDITPNEKILLSKIISFYINEKKCTAKKCTALISYTIDKTLCKGCSLCSKKCPNKAISGEVKKSFSINNELCIRCGQCIASCKFGAIKIESGVK